MPPRFTPFYQSLANRGMQNTNRNVGQMNMPPSGAQRQPNYSNPQSIYGFENQGGGIGDYLNPPNQSIGMNAPSRRTPLPGQNVGQMPIGGGGGTMGGGQGAIGGEYGGMTDIVDTETGIPNVGPDEFDEFDLNQDGYIDMLDFIFGQQSGVNMGLLEDIFSHVSGGNEMFQQPETLTQFAGGGGQAGQAAKKLYYPGTQGGFASVGTGIGGGSTLEELLKGLQG